MTIAQRQIGKMLLAPLLGFGCRSAMFLASRFQYQYQYQYHHQRHRLEDLFVRRLLRFRDMT